MSGLIISSIAFEEIKTPEGPMIAIRERATGKVIDVIDRELAEYMLGRAIVEAKGEERDESENDGSVL